MSDIAQIAALTRLEKVIRISTENLSRRFKKDPGIWYQLRNRESRIVNAVFTAHEVIRHDGTIGPRQHMIVKGVDLAKSGTHLACSHEQTTGDRRECQITFLEGDTLFAEGEKEVGAGVWIDNRLERRLRFMHL